MYLLIIMAIRPDALPTDLAALTEMVLALDAENEKLRVAMQTLKEMMFGKRSERLAALVAEQLALELDDLETGVTPPAPANDDLPATKPAGKPRKKASRNIGALPKHLPRCEQVLEPDATACPCCEGRLHKIGEDVSEVLDVIPAILRVLRTIRPKYACRSCTDGVVQAKVLPRLIESGMASTALVTHVVVSKFAWYLPLYRQVQILAGQGIHLDRATLAGWVKRAAWWLKSLYERSCRRSRPRRECSATRRRCRCSTLDDAAPGPASSGRMRWMIGRGAVPHRRRSPMCSPTAAAPTRSPDNWWASPVFCRWTAMPPTRRSPAAMAARSGSLSVLLMPDANSSRCTRRRGRRSRTR
jgi:transposase